MSDDFLDGPNWDALHKRLEPAKADLHSHFMESLEKADPPNPDGMDSHHDMGHHMHRSKVHGHRGGGKRTIRTALNALRHAGREGIPEDSVLETMDEGGLKEVFHKVTGHEFGVDPDKDKEVISAIRGSAGEGETPGADTVDLKAMGNAIGSSNDTKPTEASRAVPAFTGTKGRLTPGAREAKPEDTPKPQAPKPLAQEAAEAIAPSGRALDAPKTPKPGRLAPTVANHPALGGPGDNAIDDLNLTRPPKAVTPNPKADAPEAPAAEAATGRAARAVGRLKNLLGGNKKPNEDKRPTTSADPATSTSTDRSNSRSIPALGPKPTQEAPEAAKPTLREVPQPKKEVASVPQSYRKPFSELTDEEKAAHIQHKIDNKHAMTGEETQWAMAQSKPKAPEAAEPAKDRLVREGAERADRMERENAEPPKKSHLSVVPDPEPPKAATPIKPEAPAAPEAPAEKPNRLKPTDDDVFPPADAKPHKYVAPQPEPVEDKPAPEPEKVLTEDNAPALDESLINSLDSEDIAAVREAVASGDPAKMEAVSGKLRRAGNRKDDEGDEEGSKSYHDASEALGRAAEAGRNGGGSQGAEDHGSGSVPEAATPPSSEASREVPDPQAEVASEPKSLKDEIKDEVKDAVKEQVVSEIKDEIVSEIKDEIVSEIKDELGVGNTKPDEAPAETPAPASAVDNAPETPEATAPAVETPAAPKAEKPKATKVKGVKQQMKADHGPEIAAIEESVGIKGKEYDELRGADQEIHSLAQQMQKLLNKRLDTAKGVADARNTLRDLYTRTKNRGVARNEQQEAAFSAIEDRLMRMHSDLNAAFKDIPGSSEHRGKVTPSQQRAKLDMNARAKKDGYEGKSGVTGEGPERLTPAKADAPKAGPQTRDESKAEADASLAADEQVMREQQNAEFDAEQAADAQADKDVAEHAPDDGVTAKHPDNQQALDAAVERRKKAEDRLADAKHQEMYGDSYTQAKGRQQAAQDDIDKETKEIERLASAEGPIEPARRAGPIRREEPKKTEAATEAAPEPAPAEAVDTAPETPNTNAPSIDASSLDSEDEKAVKDAVASGDAGQMQTTAAKVRRAANRKEDEGDEQAAEEYRRVSNELDDAANAPYGPSNLAEARGEGAPEPAEATAADEAPDAVEIQNDPDNQPEDVTPEQVAEAADEAVAEERPTPDTPVATDVPPIEFDPESFDHFSKTVEAKALYKDQYDGRKAGDLWIAGANDDSPEEVKQALRNAGFVQGEGDKSWQWNYDGPDKAGAKARLKEELAKADKAYGRTVEAEKFKEPFPPTAEQGEIINDVVKDGKSVTVHALAGTGKTTTLQALARRLGKKKIAYIVFNRKNAVEAKQKMPVHVESRTANSFAYAAMTRGQKKRTKKYNEGAPLIAKRFDARPVERGENPLSPNQVAELAQEAVTNYAISADPTVGEQHLSPDLDEFARPEVLRVAKALWADKADKKGESKLTFDDNVKLWALSKPDLSKTFDVVFLDEAQDTNPVLYDLLNKQKKIQKVYVGDPNQAIYDFRGAKGDALDHMPTDSTRSISKSFRFGPEIAAYGNRFLQAKGVDARLEGNEAKKSSVGPMDNPDAVLTRGNAAAMAHVLEAVNQGKTVAVPKGPKDLIEVAEAAKALTEGRRATHEELKRFKDWAAVQRYAQGSKSAGSMRTLVQLVDEHGPDKLIEQLKGVKDAEDINHGAEFVVSTAHRSKGLEWNRVKIADDFPQPKTDEDGNVVLPEGQEMNLAYVAATRAMEQLDPGSLAWIEDHSDDNGGASAPKADAPEAPATNRLTPAAEAPQQSSGSEEGTANAPETLPDTSPQEVKDVQPDSGSEPAQATSSPAAPAPDDIDAMRVFRGFLPTATPTLEQLQSMDPNVRVAPEGGFKAGDLKVGDNVLVHARGKGRIAKVTSVGKTNVQVAHVPPNGWKGNGYDAVTGSVNGKRVKLSEIEAVTDLPFHSNEFTARKSRELYAKYASMSPEQITAKRKQLEDRLAKAEERYKQAQELAGKEYDKWPKGSRTKPAKYLEAQRAQRDASIDIEKQQAALISLKYAEENLAGRGTPAPDPVRLTPAKQQTLGGGEENMVSEPGALAEPDVTTPAEAVQTGMDLDVERTGDHGEAQLPLGTGAASAEPTPDEAPAAAVGEPRAPKGQKALENVAGKIYDKIKFGSENPSQGDRARVNAANRSRERKQDALTEIEAQQNAVKNLDSEVRNKAPQQLVDAAQGKLRWSKDSVSLSEMQDEIRNNKAFTQEQMEEMVAERIGEGWGDLSADVDSLQGAFGLNDEDARALLADGENGLDDPEKAANLAQQLVDRTYFGDGNGPSTSKGVWAKQVAQHYIEGAASGNPSHPAGVDAKTRRELEQVFPIDGATPEEATDVVRSKLKEMGISDKTIDAAKPAESRQSDADFNNQLDDLFGPDPNAQPARAFTDEPDTEAPAPAEAVDTAPETPALRSVPAPESATGRAVIPSGSTAEARAERKQKIREGHDAIEADEAKLPEDLKDLAGVDLDAKSEDVASSMRDKAEGLADRMASAADEASDEKLKSLLSGKAKGWAKQRNYLGVKARHEQLQASNSQLRALDRAIPKLEGRDRELAERMRNEVEAMDVAMRKVDLDMYDSESDGYQMTAGRGGAGQGRDKAKGIRTPEEIEAEGNAAKADLAKLLRTRANDLRNPKSHEKEDWKHQLGRAEASGKLEETERQLLGNLEVRHGRADVLDSYADKLESGDADVTMPDDVVHALDGGHLGYNLADAGKEAKTDAVKEAFRDANGRRDAVRGRPEPRADVSIDALPKPPAQRKTKTQEKEEARAAQPHYDLPAESVRTLRTAFRAEGRTGADKLGSPAARKELQEAIKDEDSGEIRNVGLSPEASELAAQMLERAADGIRESIAENLATSKDPNRSSAERTLARNMGIKNQQDLANIDTALENLRGGKAETADTTSAPEPDVTPEAQAPNAPEPDVTPEANNAPEPDATPEPDVPADSGPADPVEDMDGLPEVEGDTGVKAKFSRIMQRAKDGTDDEDETKEALDDFIADNEGLETLENHVAIARAAKEAIGGEYERPETVDAPTKFDRTLDESNVDVNADVADDAATRAAMEDAGTNPDDEEPGDALREPVRVTAPLRDVPSTKDDAAEEVPARQYNDDVYEPNPDRLDAAMDLINDKWTNEQIAGSPWGIEDEIYDQIYNPPEEPKEAATSQDDYDKQRFMGMTANEYWEARKENKDLPMAIDRGYWHMRFGKNGAVSYEPEDSANIRRFYMNIKPDNAGEFANDLQSALDKAGVKFQFKMPVNIDNFNRVDAAVLYVDKSDFDKAKKAVLDYNKAHKDHFAEGTPQFTKELASGVATADEPDQEMFRDAGMGGRNGHSFGTANAAIISNALKQLLRENPNATAAEKKAAVRAMYDDLGLDPDRPWLNKRRDGGDSDGGGDNNGGGDSGPDAPSGGSSSGGDEAENTGSKDETTAKKDRDSFTVQYKDKKGAVQIARFDLPKKAGETAAQRRSRAQRHLMDTKGVPRKNITSVVHNEATNFGPAFEGRRNRLAPTAQAETPSESAAAKIPKETWEQVYDKVDLTQQSPERAREVADSLEGKKGWPVQQASVDVAAADMRESLTDGEKKMLRDGEVPERLQHEAIATGNEVGTTDKARANLTSRYLYRLGLSTKRRPGESDEDYKARTAAARSAVYFDGASNRFDMNLSAADRRDLKTALRNAGLDDEQINQMMGRGRAEGN